MSTTDGTKSAGNPDGASARGSRQKGEQAKKAVPRGPAPGNPQTPDQELQPQPQPVHAEVPKLDPQPPAIEQPVAAIAASPDPQPAASLPPVDPARRARVSPTFTVRAGLSRACFSRTFTAEPALSEAAPAEPAPVSLQTITNAYRDYTRKSFEEFGSFFEQLSGVRSLDKAMSVHTEFVKRAYETSVAESQKICELHNRLARQTLEPLQGLVGKARETRGKS